MQWQWLYSFYYEYLIQNELLQQTIDIITVDILNQNKLAQLYNTQTIRQTNS